MGTEAYIPSYTRGVMDKNNGAPVMAMHTRTETETKCVFLSPAKDPDAKDARKLRSPDSMGPAYIAFGVPLRKLKLKLDATRKEKTAQAKAKKEAKRAAKNPSGTPPKSG